MSISSDPARHHDHRDNGARDFPVVFHLISGVLTLIVLVGGFGWWAATVPIAGAVIAPGQVQVGQRRQIVQHPDGGVVEAILVSDGTLVEQGAVLIRLDATILARERAVTHEQMLELFARKARLEAERDGRGRLVFDRVRPQPGAISRLMQGQQRLFEARAETLNHLLSQLARRRDQIALQIEGVNALRTALDRQIELIGQELAAQQLLFERGLAQAARVLGLQREEARLLGRIGELAASATGTAKHMTEIDLQSLGHRTRRREEALSELSDLRLSLVQVEAQLSNLDERLYRLDIRAPVSGIVHGLNVFAPRAVLRPAEEILSLIPQDRPLVIAVHVEPVHVDQVFTGQEAALRFPAFDASATPELYGVVTRISADAFSNETTGGSYYRAEIALNPGEVNKLPQGRALLPGMPVDAYFRTGERTTLTYLIKPLAEYFNRAFRER